MKLCSCLLVGHFFMALLLIVYWFSNCTTLIVLLVILIGLVVLFVHVLAVYLQLMLYDKNKNNNHD